MTIRFKKQEGDVLSGVIGYRAPDGSIIKTVKFYSPGAGTATKAEKLTEEEKDVCEGIVQTMTDMFGEYVRGVQALERKEKRKSK